MSIIIYMFIILAHKTLEVSGCVLWIQMCTYNSTSALMIHV